MSFLFACIIFFTMCSVMVFLPGNLVIAWIILSSAFHLSCIFLALLYAMSCFWAIKSNRFFGLSPSITVSRNVKLYASFFNSLLKVKFSPSRSSLSAASFSTCPLTSLGHQVYVWRGCQRVSNHGLVLTISKLFQWPFSTQFVLNLLFFVPHSGICVYVFLWL